MSAGTLADAFDVSKPTMSAHFAVSVAADLIEAEKNGRTIMYRLTMSVLEEVLMDFAQASGLQVTPETPATTARGRTKEKSRS
jgi:DNA-binding transcriptional ArsR family regulator